MSTEVPWGDGKRTLTKAYMLFLARWARRLSWKETAEAFRTSWEKVFDAVEHVVTRGLEHRKLGQIDAIGVDEIQYAKGHKYLMLVYQIDIGITRLLWVGKERTVAQGYGQPQPVRTKVVGSGEGSQDTDAAAGGCELYDLPTASLKIADFILTNRRGTMDVGMQTHFAQLCSNIEKRGSFGYACPKSMAS